MPDFVQEAISIRLDSAAMDDEVVSLARRGAQESLRGLWDPGAHTRIFYGMRVILGVDNDVNTQSA
jgi:hypothetical protein